MAQGAPVVTHKEVTRVVSAQNIHVYRISNVPGSFLVWKSTINDLSGHKDQIL